MPIKHGYERVKGKGWYKWGEHGKKYTYTIGNKQQREKALDKAKLQMRAIKVRQNH